MRDPLDYTIEVCIECGAQLSRNTLAGRCPNRDHWERGGMVVRVMPRPLAEQDELSTQRRWRVLSTTVAPRERQADE